MGVPPSSTTIRAVNSTITTRSSTTTSTNKKKEEPRQISWKEFSNHINSKDSLWINVDNKVYDIAPWVDQHPGGKEVLQSLAGRDATQVLKQFHRPESYKYRLPQYYVGALVNSDGVEKEGNTDFLIDMNQLETDLQEEGWYKPSKSYMIQKTIQSLILFGAAWACVWYGKQEEQVWVQYVGALLIGMTWIQSNFLGHDVGHASVFDGNVAAHSFYGLCVGPALSGISLAWWKHSHYTHHVMTNCITHDPDIQHMPVLAISTKFFTGVFSEFHKVYFPFDKFTRALISYQHWVYYPIMTVSRVNMHAQSIIHVLRHPSVSPMLRLKEFTALCVFWGYWICMLSCLPTWKSMALFYYLSHFMVALIHIQICLSHFKMETFASDEQYQLHQESFYEYQLRTSLDIDCPEWMDWLHGGLQYQTAHHMFPRMPRHRLRALQERIMRICDKHKIKYHHYGFIEANIMTIRHMRKVAMAARAGNFVKMKDTMIFQGANMIG